MVEASPPFRNLRFGPYEADLSTGELRRDGSKVSLQDKPFQILALLVQHPGELVTREELRSRLWPADTFVDFEHGLNTAVKKLRQALDDSPEQPRYVETLPKRGYRFLAPVDVDGAATESPVPRPATALDVQDPARPQRARWRVHAVWLAAVIGVAGLSSRLGPGDRVAIPPPNRQPVIVLMDSPLPGRVYDPRTVAAGGTNADDLTDALRDLPVVIEKENTSPMWHREAQVLQQNPDLIVSHLSCLFDQRWRPPVTRRCGNSSISPWTVWSRSSPTCLRTTPAHGSSSIRVGGSKTTAGPTSSSRTPKRGSPSCRGGCTPGPSAVLTTRRRSATPRPLGSSASA